MNIRNAIITLTALISVGTLAVPATASDAQPASAKVRVADLDLRSASDVQILYARLGSAARDLCAHKDRADPINFYRAGTYQQCITATLDEVVSRAGIEALSAVHEMRTERQERQIAGTL